MNSKNASLSQHTICVGAVVRQGDRVLLVRQAKGHTLEGQWVIPWGLLDEGESPAKAAQREVLEEAGIDTQVEGLLGMQELPAPWEGWIGLIFLCHSFKGQPVPDKRETDAARFFSLHELQTLEEPVEDWCAWMVHRILGEDYRIIPKTTGNPYKPHQGFV